MSLTQAHQDWEGEKSSLSKNKKKQLETCLKQVGFYPSYIKSYGTQVYHFTKKFKHIWNGDYGGGEGDSSLDKLNLSCFQLPNFDGTKIGMWTFPT